MGVDFCQRYTDTELTANNSSAKHVLGTLRREPDNTNGGFLTYRYVQAAADTTIANGTALGFSDVRGNVASSDYDDFAVASQHLGVGIGTITASYYGWVQVGGYHSAIKKKAGVDTIADGTWLGLASDADGVVNTSTNLANANAYFVRAVGASDDTADTVPGYITGLMV